MEQDWRAALEGEDISKPAPQSRYPKWWRDGHYFMLCVLPLPFWVIAYRLGVQPTSSAWVLLLAAPLLEEIVFRGALQGWLLNNRGGRPLFGPLSWANFLTSVAFAALHGLNQGGGVAWMTVFPSLIFGHCRERYGVLPPCIILHAIFNAGLLI